MDALFLSDVHVSPDRPDAVRCLLELLAGPARRARNVYVLGDLFDQWLGDDDAGAPHSAVEAGLARLVDSGAFVGVSHGNHDFLLGAGFAERTGCTLLAEPTVVELTGERVVLMHGDSLCIDDTDYQAFRAYTRDADNQAWFLGLPLAERAEVAAELRHRSAELKPLETDEIMDVNAGAVVECLREHRATHLVHGHTHRPAIHRLEVDGRTRHRTVLGDWYRSGVVATWESEGPQLVDANALLARS